MPLVSVTQGHIYRPTLESKAKVDNIRQVALNTIVLIVISLILEHVLSPIPGHISLHSYFLVVKLAGHQLLLPAFEPGRMGGGTAGNDANHITATATLEWWMDVV